MRTFLQFKPCTFFLLALAATIAVWSPNNLANNRIKLPDIGSTSGAIISTELEKTLGKLFIRSVRRRVPMIQDQEINDYIQQLGNKIAKSSEQPNRHFSFFGVDNRSINAFAGPNGYIGINSGLIMVTESESELASVFAHEVGHVTQHHLQRAIEAANQMSLPSAAATLAAVVLGVALPGIGPAALIAVQAGRIQKQINFTRSHEAEADRVGIQNLAAAGFDPRSMPIFFGRLQTATRYYSQKIPEILRTHPAPTSRISDTASRADKYPYKQVSDSQDFRLIKMKVRINAKQLPISELITSLKNESHQGINKQKAAAQYGLALAYKENFQYKKAQTILRTLTQQYPKQSHYLTAYALNELASGDGPKSLQLLEKAAIQFPDNRAVNLLHARLLLHLEQPKKSIPLLIKDAKQYEASPRVYDMLAIAYGQANDPVHGFQYKAEYFYLIGKTRDAIIQLEQAALAAKDNFYLTSQIKNRISLLTEELREQESY